MQRSTYSGFCEHSLLQLLMQCVGRLRSDTTSWQCQPKFLLSTQPGLICELGYCIQQFGLCVQCTCSTVYINRNIQIHHRVMANSGQSAVTDFCNIEKSIEEKKKKKTINKDQVCMSHTYVHSPHYYHAEQSLRRSCANNNFSQSKPNKAEKS